MSNLAIALHALVRMNVNTNAGYGAAMIAHTLYTKVLDDMGDRLAVRQLKYAQKISKSAAVETDKDLREKMRAWHKACVESAENFDLLIYPAVGEHQIIGTFVSTTAPTKKQLKADATCKGGISYGKTFGGNMSKLCTIFKNGGHDALMSCNNSTDVEVLYQTYRKLNEKTSVRSEMQAIAANVFDGYVLPADTTMSAELAMEYRAVLLKIKDSYAKKADEVTSAVAA